MIHQTDTPPRGLYFDSVAQLYDRARPAYPERLFDDLLAYADCRQPPRALKIGCGTGQATRSLARRGLAIISIEPGARLAALARDHLAEFPNVEIICTRFEDWQPRNELFELVFSANAIHWVDRNARIHKTARVLRANGTLALFRSFPVISETPLDASIRSILGQPFAAAGAKGKLPREDAFRKSGAFDAFETASYERDQLYDANGYVALLSTLNRFKSMEPSERAKRFRIVHHLISNDAGNITVRYVTRLLLARRRRRRSWLAKLFR